METIKHESNPPLSASPRPCEYFDLICGTSTGGLIAIMLGRLGMSVERCINIYLKLSKKVFDEDKVLAGVIPVGDDAVRFDHNTLEQEIKTVVESETGSSESSMEDLELDFGVRSSRTFVVAIQAQIATAQPTLFRSYSCTGYAANICPIWQCARATTAAPSYFKPAFISVPPPGDVYIDGGVRYNNPASLALDEASRIWPDVKRFTLISVGTGRQRSAEFIKRSTVKSAFKSSVECPTSSDVQSPPSIRKSGFFRSLFGKAHQVIRVPQGIRALKNIGENCVTLSTDSERVHQDLLRRVHSPNPDLSFPYFRFNVEQGMEDIALEEWDDAIRMNALTLGYMEEEQQRQVRICCAQELIFPGAVECFGTSQNMFLLCCPVPDRNNDFTGRVKQLEFLRNKFSDAERFHHRIALFGLGGVGKSQLAIEYAYRYAAEYDHVFWITAVERAKVLAKFIRIARAAGCIPLHEGRTAEHIAVDVRLWLQTIRRWLIVFDNLDEMEVIKNLLPVGSIDNHILITTRNANTFSIQAYGFEVGVLDNEDTTDAVKLLLIRSNIGYGASCDLERLEAREIVKELGYLPLAMEQAAAYIRDALGGDIYAFLPLYRRYRSKLHERRSPSCDYPNSVATTWGLSMSILEVRHPTSLLLLNLFVFLNPDEILIEFLRAGADGLESELRDLVVDNHAFSECICSLTEFSLIRRSKRNSSVSIHRLVQAVIQDKLTEAEYHRLRRNAKNLSAFAFRNGGSTEELEVCRRFYQQILPCMDGTEEESRALVDMLSAMGVFLNLERQENAGKLVGWVADMARLSDSNQDPEGMTSSDLLNRSYQLRYLFYEYWTMLGHGPIDPGRGPTDPDSSQSRHIRIQLDGMIGLIPLLTQTAIALKEKYGEQHPDTLSAIKNVDDVKRMTRHLEVIRSLLGYDQDRRPFRPTDEVFGIVRYFLYTLSNEDDPLPILKTMRDLAKLYMSWRQWTSAETILFWAVQTSRDILGENHSDTWEAFLLIQEMHNMLGSGLDTVEA